MTATAFADRLAYIRLLRWLRSGARAPETDGEFAEAIGVSLPWVTKWKSRDEAPDGRDLARAIIRALGDLGVTEEWLFDGEGSAPEPDRWHEWIEGRKLRRRDSRPAKVEEPDVPAPRPAAKRKGA